MSETAEKTMNKQYLAENGLPPRLQVLEGCIGERLDGGFRNLFTISDCYGEYAAAVARKLVCCYNGPTIYQMHWQFKDGRTEMKSQTELDMSDENSGYKDWQEQVAEDHPLPEGAEWMWCNQDSEHFLLAVDER